MDFKQEIIIIIIIYYLIVVKEFSHDRVIVVKSSPQGGVAYRGIKYVS